MNNENKPKRSYVKEREVQIKQLEKYLKKIELKKDDTNKYRNNS